MASALASTVLLVLLCTTATAGNLLENGYFEGDPTGAELVPGWTANAELAQQKLWLDAEQPHSGRRCVAIRSLLDTGGRSVLSQEAAIEPHHTYALSLWARRDSFVYGTEFEVLLLAGDTELGRQQKSFRSTTWRPVQMTFDSGEADRASVRITTPNKGDWRITVGRTLYVDDVSLVAVDPSSDIILDGGAKSRVAAQTSVKEAGPYYLWARVRCPGQDKLTLAAGGGSWDFRCYTTGEWYWLRPILPELLLEAGEQDIRITSEDPGSEIERVILTMDPFWAPEGARQFVAPDAVKAARLAERFEPVKRGTVTLTVAGETAGDRPWGITQGLPFPRGVLRSAESVRLTGGPLQAQTLARWPDDSVKWLLVSTLARGRETLLLEYGDEVQQATAQDAVIVSEDAAAVTVDTGRLSFTVPRDGSALFSGVKCGQRTIERAEAVVNGDCSSSGAGAEVVVEESGPVRAVVRVSGEHRNHAGEKLLDYILRIYAYAGADYLELEHTFLLTDDIVEVDLDSVVLRLETASEGFAINAGDETIEGDLGGGEVALVADLTTDANKNNDYPYEITQAATILAEGNEAQGRFTMSGAGPLQVCVRDFWQNAPKSLRLARDKIDIGLVGGATKFYHGMGKTHHLLLSLAEDPAAVQTFAEHPLLLAPTEWYCDSGALDALPAPRREGEFAGYEKCIDVTIADWVGRHEGAVYRRGFGGLLNYGDSAYGKGGNNLETALGEGAMVQFLRSGERPYFDFAEMMVGHFADIDIDHSGSSGGLIWVHSAHARTTVDPGAAGINGHSWFNGTVYYGLFTGSRRILDLAPAVGDYYARHPFPLQPYIHYWRKLAWKLMDLMCAYDVTGDVKYLEAALADVKVTAYQRDHLITLWPYMFAVGMKGLRHYYDATGDPEARELYLQLMDGFLHLRARPDDTVNGEWPKDEGMLLGNFPNDRSCAFYNEAAHAYRLTGDRRFVQLAGEDLNWQITFGVTDPTLLWGSADLVRAMGECGITEPELTATLPAVFMTPPAEPPDHFPQFDQPTVVLQVNEEQDGPFTVALFKSSYHKYTHDYQGTAKLYAPEGKLVDERAVRTSGLRKYHFDVPRDGQTGLYTLLVSLDDPWRWTLTQLDFDLDAGRRTLQVRPRYDRLHIDCFCLAPAGEFFPTLHGEPPRDAIWLEAESDPVPPDYTVVPDASAQGGACIRSAKTWNEANLERAFEVPEAGSFRFFARIWKPYADLLYVSVDDGEEHLVQQTHDMDGNAYPVWSIACTLGEDAVTPYWGDLPRRNMRPFNAAGIRATPALAD